MTIDQHTPISFNREGITDDELVTLYTEIMIPRLIEDRMLILLRQGKISKWFSGYGQEATSVGATLALDKEEIIFPMHRNLGMFTAREVPMERLFAQFQGKNSGFTKGRDRSFHFGTMEYNLVGMISHLGPQMGLADGVALAEKLGGTNRCTLVVTGDGGASEGDFHEALNVAAVWDLPVIFLVENNRWGLSTPSREQFRCKEFIDKGIGYGMEAIQVDGNNILEVYSTVKRIAADIRKNPRPVLLESMTFRMRGHEEASGTKYYPAGLQEEWQVKDPVLSYENFLMELGILNKDNIDEIRQLILAEIKKGLDIAFGEAEVQPDLATELNDVYYPYVQEVKPAAGESTQMRFIDSITDGLREAMRKHDKLVLMGQDIADYGGVFKVTDGFVEEFGKGRVRNTPLCESAIVGAALGLSIRGYKSMMEMQFADFVTEGFNQIVNNLAKIHYRWGQKADVVIRMPTGAGSGAGPYHSQSNEAWFFHTPGLKIVYPSTPEDAKGLLLAAFEDPNPVMFFEHKNMYRSLSGEVLQGYYTTEIGKARMVREGSAVTIITYGYGVLWAQEVLDTMPDLDAELIDLRTLLPLDKDAIFNSVKKTGRAIILHEDCMTGGIGGEISALIMEECFEFLDAPVKRVGSLDTPVPFAIPLEKQFLPVERFKQALKELVDF
ncbi:MAG: dehydrogenase E1 component subunit alpha/beta [Bacteroidota bacterium]